jgi:predicted phage replisome organizer
MPPVRNTWLGTGNRRLENILSPRRNLRKGGWRRKMAEVQWIKIYIDMFDKRKIKKIRRLPAGNDLLLIWIMLLAMAGKCNAGGMIYITESVPFTEEDIADELDFDVNTIRLALKAFEELDMIDTSDDGFINVIGWEEYQNADKLAELRAKDRERKRLKRAQAKGLLTGESEDVHGLSTDCPSLEEDKEEDKEKEKEYHSSIHTAESDIERDFRLYVQKQVEESELEGQDAEVYKKECEESLKLKYMRGELGKGVVLMSDEQFSDLMERLSWEELHKYFDIIVDCEQNGKRFKRKSHYQAILDMVNKDRRFKKGSPKPRHGNFDPDEAFSRALERTYENKENE